MKAYVAETPDTKWITLTGVAAHGPATLTLTEAEAKALRNKLNAVLGGIEKARREARHRPT